MGKASRKKNKTQTKEGLSQSDTQAVSAKPSLFQAITGGPIVHLFLIAALGLLAYSNTFQAPFFFDDATNIFWNPVIKDLDNFFLSTEAYRYNPRRFVGYLTFALNFHIGGSNVEGYHAVNLAVHIFNALLVYCFAMLTFKTPFFRAFHNRTNMEGQPNPDAKLFPSPRLIALFAGLFFVAHPLATQSVTYIVQRYTSLATLFFMLSLIFYIKGRLLSQHLDVETSGSKFIHLAKSFVLFMLSLFSAILAMHTKEIAFTLPLVVVLYEFAFFKASIKWKLAFLLPVLLTLAIIPLTLINPDRSLTEIIAQINAVTRLDTDMPRWDYLMTQLRVITTYIRLLFLPINQNLDYDYPLYHSLLSPSVFASFLFLTGLALSAVYLFYRSRVSNCALRIIAFGIFWFFITLAVESSIIPIVDVIFEHRTYLPSVGAFIAIITALFVLAQHTRSAFRNHRSTSCILFLLALALAATTYGRNNVWQSEISLWQDVAKKSPNKERVHNNLGIAYQAKLQSEKAIEQFKKVLELNPENAEAHNNLGIAFNSQGQQTKALEYFQETLRLAPNNAMAHNNLGSIYEEQGQLEKAIQHYQKAVLLKPNFVMAHNNLGNAYLNQGMTEEAIEEFQAALKLKPDEAEVLYNLGVAYLSKGMLPEAIKYLEKALSINYIYSEAHNNLGVAFGSQGNFDKAIKHFQIAIQQNPNNIGARNNLEIARQRLTN